MIRATFYLSFLALLISTFESGVSKTIWLATAIIITSITIIAAELEDDNQ